METSSKFWLRFYSKMLVVVTFLLIVAGGLVKSTESGLAVPDWPLSYGQWMPPMVGGIFYEHSHRMIASLVGLMTLILAVWLQFSEQRKWVRWCGIAALAAVVVQGVLGGITVLMLLPAPISIFHGVLAQSFFTLVVCIAYFLSREWQSSGPVLDVSDRPALHKTQRTLIVLVALLLMQLILGAAFRHTKIFAFVIVHIVFALAIIAHIFVIWLRTIRHFYFVKRFLNLAIWLGVLSVIQIGLGAGAFVYTEVFEPILPVPPQVVTVLTAHQSTGALLLASAVFFIVRLKRLTVPRASL